MQGSGWCNACGKALFPGARFCTYCGAVRQAAAAEGREILEIRRVGIASVAKLFFLLNALMGLLLGLGVAALGMSGMGSLTGPLGAEIPLSVPAAPWVALVLVFPVVYGILGGLMGMILALLYNVLAWGVGGLRLWVGRYA